MQNPSPMNFDEISTDDQWHFKNAKPFQYRPYSRGWYISTSDGTTKPLPTWDWSASTREISFTAWKPVKLTDECIDIWSPTLRNAIREACPNIYKTKSETILSLQKVLENYEMLDQYIRDKQQHVSPNDQVVEELKLFAYVFLQCGDIAKFLGTFGFEKLYEDKILSMSHWEHIQQVAFERDLDTLDRAFDAAEKEAAKAEALKVEALNAEAAKVEAARGDEFYNFLSGELDGPPGPQPQLIQEDGYWLPSPNNFFVLGEFDYSFGPQSQPIREDSPWLPSPNNFLDVSWGEFDYHPVSQPRLIKEDGNWLSSFDTGFRWEPKPQQDSIENANRVLNAVSTKVDTLAKKLLARNGYSGFEQRSVELALRQEDFETARLLIAADFPMREAVMAGNLGLVQRLICYEVDPNDGPCFMERPFQTAIMIGNLEIARYLIWRCNIADLGNLWAPLCLALRKGVLEEAQAILNRPRTLTSHDINGTSATMMQALRENLRTEHNSFLAASLDSKASVGFQTLGDQLQDYRTLWKMGISAMRRLRKDRAPSDFRQVISLLLVASAMRKTCSVEEFGDYDAFLLDLRRWRRLAVEESQRGVFDELVFCLWDQEMHPIEGDVDDFGKDLNFLRAFTREFAETTNPSDSAVFHEMPGAEQESDSSVSNAASEHHRPEAQRSDEDPVPIPETQTTSLSCTIAAYLRVGAIFCFFIACLLVFQGFSMQGTDLQSPGLFSSSIDAAYVAPMQLVSPSWCSFPSFVEKARSKIRDGSIRTVTDLNDFMYYKALSSMPLGQVWDQSLMRKVIETGSVSLKRALKHWTTQKSLTYMTVYHGLQPTVASVTSCIDDNPKSSIATDLRELSYSLQKPNISPIGGISTPASLQTSQTSTSTSRTPSTSGSMTQHKSQVQTNAEGETAFSPPQAWSPVSSSYVPQSTIPMSQEPSPHLRAISIPRPRKHANRIRKKSPPEDRTCEVCGLVLSSVGNKNRHVDDKHQPVNGSGGGDGLSQESSPATGSPSGMLARKPHFCRFRCGARYAQARNRDDHERKQCRKRGASYGVGKG